MYLTESHIIKPNKNLDDICFKTKNLYNKANYIIRQEFIGNGNYISVYDMYTLMKEHDEYKDLITRIARPVLRTLNANWKGFFRSIKEWNINKGKFNGRPKLPNYLRKDKFTAILVDNSIKTKNLKSNGYIELSDTGVKIPFKNNGCKIIEVQIVPLRSGKYKINIIYEKTEILTKINNDRYCSIDLGVNNLMSLTSNVGICPLIINGRPLKSINQFYNKKKSKLQSKLGEKIYISKKTIKLDEKRNNKINDYLHKSSRKLIDYCLLNDLNTIIIGYNRAWKQKVNIGKKNNQNFVQIPFYKLISMIEYKGKLNGLNVILNEESYTSKCSFMDNEEVRRHVRYKGKRISRGMFESSNGFKINADINASFNILKKVVPDFKWDRGCAVHPKLISLI